MLTLELAKAHLRSEGSFEDELIQSYIDAAQAHLESYTGRKFARGEVVQEASGFSPYLRLWWGPAPASAVIDYLDAAAAAATVSAPRLVRDRIYPPLAGWPSALDLSPVTITYTAGYAPGGLPPPLLHAQLMLVGHWWSHREGAGPGVAEVPLGVEALAAQYRPVLI